MVATQNQIRRIVREFVEALEPDVCVDRVILYGSYAHDRAHEWSDIDVAVLSFDFKHMPEIVKADLLARKLIHCDSRLIPVAYTPDQFDNAPPYLFAAEIRRTGKVIYDARRKRNGKKTTAKHRAAGAKRSRKVKEKAG